MKFFKNKSLLVCLIFLICSFWITLNTGKWKKCQVLNWDISSYYLYLPAVFIYGDLYELKFYDKIETTYRPSHNKRHAIHKSPIKNKNVIKYSCGVALFQLPLYFVAHYYCKISKKYPLDGYSPPFQLSVALSTILFCFLGFLILSNFLLRYFSDISTAATIIILAFGTNIFLYSSMQQGMSHIYLFFLYACVLNLTDLWYQNPTYKKSILLGLVIGLATLTRPTDILLACIPLFWRVSDLKLVSKIAIENKFKLLVSILVFIIPVCLQLIYWKQSTGNWFYYSYQNEGFNFFDWKIIEALFSYRKGWFVYTPLALFGFIGLYFVAKEKGKKFYLIPFLAYYIPTLYILFCWSMWYYGGSFGCRVLIQSLAILAFPMTQLNHYIFSSAKKYIKFTYVNIIGLFIILNFFQSWQYNRGIIHWESMNKEYYWRVFGKINVTEEDKSLLK